jgi:peroxiredoxin
MLPQGATNGLVGNALPEFRGATLAGTELDSAELRGKPVVVKFFAEYCVPCQRTLPAVERLHRARPDVAFVGVSEDDRAATAEAIVKEYGLSFPVLHDASKELMQSFRIRELPATFVVDRHGVVRWVAGPSQSERDLDEALRLVAE